MFYNLGAWSYQYLKISVYGLLEKIIVPVALVEVLIYKPSHVYLTPLFQVTVISKQKSSPFDFEIMRVGCSLNVLLQKALL